MKEDVAIRFAAIAEEGVTSAEARHIISEFLTYLKLCPVCEDSGRFVFNREVEVSAVFRGRHDDGAQLADIGAGTESACPRCGGPDDDGTIRGDPSYVAWHCTRGDTEDFCRGDRSGDADRRSPHAECGYRIMLPLNLEQP
jgi:DNA-directed RNA polymerase subunit RPC12/RpoP